MILSIHPNDRNDELTTALGEKADTPDIKARESRSFMVSCVLNGREDVRLMRKANSNLRAWKSQSPGSTYASRHNDGQLLLEL